MALLESITLPLGTAMPDFTLQDPTGATYSRKQLAGSKGLLVVFTCNHCPYAIAVWPRLIRIANEAKKLGINTVAVNPNINPDYPDDAPPRMAEKIKLWGISFPYLIDSTQQVARAYQAQCTPDLYLLDADMKLAYHGRIDDNWQDETKVKKHELKTAIEALGAGRPVDKTQHPSMGCSIKWLGK